MGVRNQIRSRFGVLAVILIALVLLAAPNAGAHSYLDRSDPADGATLALAPQSVTLYFSEPVRNTGLGISAKGPAAPVVLSARATAKRVVAIWPSDAPAGDYRVSYRVVSQDGHVMSGAIQFAVQERPSGSPSASSLPSSAGSMSPSPLPSSSGLPTEDEGVAEVAAAGQQAPGSVPAWLLGLAAILAVAGGGAVLYLRRRGSGSA